MGLFFSDFANISKIKSHLSSYELGVFFSIFVMLQFWNLFNAKYFRTDRSLIQDVIALITKPNTVKKSYSVGFICIAFAILVGQILIVTYGGRMFNVSSLSLNDWGWILLITSPVLIVADIVRFVCNMFNRILV